MSRAIEGPWEEPLPTLTGRAWAFGIVLTVADVLPPRFAALPPPQARTYVFADLDAGLAARLGRGDVVVVEELRATGDAPPAAGDGALTAAAFAALRAAGVVAAVARVYGPGIEEGALAAGVVPVTLDAPAFVHTGDRVRIDLEAAKIVNLSSGDRAAIRNFDDARRGAMRAMLEARGAT